jgi:hypothetical protein
MLPALVLFGTALGSFAGRVSDQDQTGTLEKMVVASGNVSLSLDLNRLQGNNSASRDMQTFQFGVDPNSSFTALVFNHAFRGVEPGPLALIWGNNAVLPDALNGSANQLAIEKLPAGEAFDLAIRDSKTGFVFFNVEGNQYDFNSASNALNISGSRLVISPELANRLGRTADAGKVVGTLSVSSSLVPVEITNMVNGVVNSAILPPHRGIGVSPDAAAPGPDVIVGDLPSMQQFGSSGTQVGLGVGTTSCNNGDTELDWFALPSVDHPVIPQGLYRMSGGASNNDRFEQIGQSWLKHAFTALQNNACGFGCSPAANGTHLGVGCSDPYGASLNASQTGLGSRAWVNPFTGAYASTAADHSSHSHNGTSHRILVEAADLDTTQNAGATYYAEAQYVTPHEFVWCQSHPGQCNMYNNASYRQFSVSGTTSFSFNAIGSTVRMVPAVTAWTGATMQTIEPAPGVDGRAFIAYKVTGPVGGIWHYEYAILNQNLDRGIQSFTVPLGCGINLTNVGFHAPPNHPGFAMDGTQNSAGYSNAAWTATQSSNSVTWNSQTFSQDQNANALRWGTMYNYRFDSNRPPQNMYGIVGFYKSGSPIAVQIQGPTALPCNVAPGSRR